MALLLLGCAPVVRIRPNGDQCQTITTLRPHCTVDLCENTSCEDPVAPYLAGFTCNLMIEPSEGVGER